ncbi:MAG: hypothetical protein QME51_06455 [Planctomycetota bacterium]|nr:hypothetical protein [Planctomycetota bacterium]
MKIIKKDQLRGANGKVINIPNLKRRQNILITLEQITYKSKKTEIGQGLKILYKGKAKRIVVYE